LRGHPKEPRWGEGEEQVATDGGSRAEAESIMNKKYGTVGQNNGQNNVHHTWYPKSSEVSAWGRRATSLGPYLACRTNLQWHICEV